MPSNLDGVGKLYSVFAFLIISVACFGQASLTGFGVTHTTNFNRSRGTCSNTTWTDNSTIPNCYSTRPTYAGGSSTAACNTGGLYISGDGTETALGGRGSGSATNISYGVRYVNNTGQEITLLSVRYRAEQWGDGREPATAVQTVFFYYSVSATPFTDVPTGASPAGYTAYPALDMDYFTTSELDNNNTTAIDGNAPANSGVLEACIPLSIPAGHEIMLRWWEPDNSGNDHTMCIDDLEVTPVQFSIDAKDDFSVCEDESIDLDVTVTPAGTYSYDWIGPNSFSGGTKSPSVANATSAKAGTYTVEVISGSCILTDDVEVTVNPKPSVSLAAFSAVCEDAADFTLTGGSPTGGTYSGTGVSGGDFSPSGAGVGVHTITYTVVDGNGCENSASETIEVLAKPNVTLANLGDVCIDAADFTLTGGSPAGGTYSGTGVSGGNFSPSAAGGGSHTITYSFTDGNGCSNTATASIQVDSKPSPTITAVANQCEDGAAITLSATPAGGTFSGAGVTGNQFDPSVAGAGNHTITYTVTNGTCTGTTNRSIQVDSKPAPTITAVANQCEDGAAVTLSATPAGGTFSGTGVTGNQFDPSVAGAGNHTITYTVTNGTCSGTTTTSIQVDSKPSPTITAVANQCEDGAAVTLNATPAGGTFSGAGVTGNQFDPSVAGAGNHTITYTVTNGTCTGTTTTSIQVDSKPSPTITAVANQCEDGGAVTLSATPAGGTFSGAGVTGNQFDPSAAGAGNHTITYTVTNGTCSGTTTTSILVNSKPAPTITAVANQCEDGAAVTLNATPVGGTFSGAGVSGNQFDPSAAGAGNHTITYTVTNGTCSGTTTTGIQVDGKPTPTITAVANQCEDGAAITLNATPAGGTFSGAGVTGNQFNPSVAGAGNHTITYTVTNGTCIGSTTTSIQVDSKPTPSITAVANQCEDGTSVTLSATPAGGTFSGAGVTGNQFDPSVAGAGNHTITYTVSNGTCTGTTTTSIQVDNKPTPTITAVANQCEDGAAVTLNATPAGGTFSGAGVTGNQFDPSVAGAGNHTITYTLTNGTCTGTTTTSIQVDSKPSPTITAVANQCEEGAVITLNATPAGGTFSGAGVTGNQFDPSVAGAGNHTITYTVTNGTCTGTTTKSIQVDSKPTPTITAVANQCEDGASITLSATPTGGTFSGAGVSGNQFDPSVAGAGNHTITYTVTNGTCTGTTTTSIQVDSKPNPTITAVANQCEDGAAVTLSATPAGGTFSGAGVSGNQFDPSVAGAGNHTITYTVTNGTCTGTATTSIQVDSKPAPTITAVANQCEDGAAITLSATPVGGTFSGAGVSGNQFDPSVAGAGNHTITYTVTNGTCTGTTTTNIQVESKPTVGVTASALEICNTQDITLDATGANSYVWEDGSSNANRVVTVSSDTSFSVTGTSGVCATMTSVSIDRHNISAIISKTNPSCFQGNDGTISVVYAGGKAPYATLWTDGPTNPNRTSLEANTYEATVTDDFGCKLTFTSTLTDPAELTIDLGNDVIQCGGTANLSGPNGFSQYAWSNGANSQNTTVGVSGNYSLTVTDADGCTATDDVDVTISTTQTTAYFQGGEPGDCWAFSANNSSTTPMGNPRSGTGSLRAGGADNSTCSAGSDCIVGGNGRACGVFHDATIAFESVNVAYYQGMVLEFYYGNHQNSCNGTGWDSGEDVYFQAIHDGVPQTPVLLVDGSGDKHVNYNFYSYNLPEGLCEFSFQVFVNNPGGTFNRSDEFIYLDDVSLSYCSSLFSQTPSITANTDTICPDESYTLSADFLLPNCNQRLATEYQWLKNGAVLSGATGSSLTLQADDFTNGDAITVQANNLSGGCSIYEVVSTPFLPFKRLQSVSPSSNSPICVDDTLRLSANLSGSQWSYSWTGPNGFTSTEENPKLADAASGNYSLAVTNSVTGCSYSGVTSVIINQLPNLVVGSSKPTYCLNETIELSASGATTVSWTGPNGFSSSNLNPNISNASSANAGKYYITAVSSQGCSVSDSIEIDVQNTPGISVTATNSTICLGDTTYLNVSSGVSFEWEDSSVENPRMVFPTATTTYTATATTSNGCSGDVSIEINVRQLPNVTIDANDFSVCTGEDSVLTASGATTYNWSTGEMGASIVTNEDISSIYEVEGTNNFGCKAKASVDVTVLNLPNVTVSGDKDEICLGETINLTAQGALTYLWSSGSSNGNRIVAPITDSTFSVIGTDGNGCQGTAIFFVEVNNLPTVSMTLSNDSICIGDAISLFAAGGSSVVWEDGSTNRSRAILGTATQLFQVTVTDNSGCSSTAQRELFVFDNPVVSSSLSADEVCRGDSSLVTLSGAETYVWQDGASTNPRWISPSNSTSYNIAAQDGNGCRENHSFALTVNEIPTPSISGPDKDCEGNTINLVASGGGSYVWEDGTSNPNRSITLSTDIVVALEVTSDAGCSAVIEKSIESLTPEPTIITPSKTEICLGETVNLDGGNALFYAWQDGSEERTFTDSPDATTTYEVTTTDVNFCTSSAEITITVNPLPTVSITANPSELCDNEPVTFTASGAENFRWTNGEETQSITYNATPGLVVGVQGEDENGCKATASHNSLIVREIPSVSISGKTIYCEGETVRLEGQGASTYNWSTSQSGNEISFTASDNRTIGIVGTSEFGCTNTASAFIQVNEMPAFNVFPNANACPGDDFYFPISFNGESPFTVRVTDRNNQTRAFVFSEETTGALQFLQPGTYTIESVADNNCTLATSRQLTAVQRTEPTAQVEVEYDRCTETAEAVIHLSGGGPYNYTVQVPGENPRQIRSFTGNTDTINNIGVDGVVLVTEVSNTYCNAPDQASTPVSLPNYPVAGVELLEEQVCLGDTVHLMLVNPTEENTYGFHHAGNYYDLSAGMIQFPGSEEGCVDILLETTLPEGCIKQNEISDVLCVKGFESPEIFGLNRLSAEDSRTQTYTVDLPKEFRYHWVANGTSSFTQDYELNPIDYYGKDSLTLCVALDDATSNVCLLDPCTTILFENSFSVYIPNAFSPEGDGINEGWGPVFSDVPSTYEIMVYNRWGNEVFYSENYLEKWDGTYKGSRDFDDNVFRYRMLYRKPGSGAKVEEFGVIYMMK